MNDYICKKCHVKAISKCVIQRSVFIEDHQATLFNMMHDLDIKVISNTSSAVAIIASRICVDSKDSKKDIFKRVLANMAMLSDDLLDVAFCDHEWQITEGTCDFGCCKIKEEVK